MNTFFKTDTDYPNSATQPDVELDFSAALCPRRDNVSLAQAAFYFGACVPTKPILIKEVAIEVGGDSAFDASKQFMFFQKGE